MIQTDNNPCDLATHENPQNQEYLDLQADLKPHNEPDNALVRKFHIISSF